MSSLQEKLQKQFTDKVKMEFRKFCLLLQAYSDSNSWVYECDFVLTDDIFWDRLTFYGGGQGVDMEGLVKSFFEYVIKADINTDELWDHIDSMYYDDVTETGWLSFEIYPNINKMKILMAYDYYYNQERDYKEYISYVVDAYAKQDKEEVKEQLKRWKEQGAIFKVKYEGSDFNEYIYDSCTSNIGITVTPSIIEDLGDLMINLYEKGYHFEDSGGSGWITVDFKEGNILMEHTEYNRSSHEVELAELNF